ncbi:MAG TPA: hypothetical protein VHH93_00090 [Gammaproteobacteria bacterium]|nr:hypothetical protein [Gammaproteobacteria bacterium]
MSGVLVHGAFQLGERATQRRVVGKLGAFYLGQAGTEQAGVAAGEEQGDAPPLVGEGVTVSCRLANDQTVQRQAAQWVGHGALGGRGERFAQERSKVLP